MMRTVPVSSDDPLSLQEIKIIIAAATTSAATITFFIKPSFSLFTKKTGPAPCQERAGLNQVSPDRVTTRNPPHV